MVDLAGLRPGISGRTESGRPEGGAGEGGDLGHAGLGIYGVLELADLSPVDLATGSARVGGPFGSPSYLGAACALLLPITGAVAADPGVNKPWRSTAGVSLIGGVVAVVASQTRAAWLGIAVAAVVVAPSWRSRLRPRWLLASGAIVVVVAMSIGPRMLDVSEGDIQGRVDEWRMGAAVVFDHPFSGVGPEGYRLAFPSVVDAEYERRYTRHATPDRAHNGALDTAATFGLPGLVAYIGCSMVHGQEVLESDQADENRCWLDWAPV